MNLTIISINVSVTYHFKKLLTFSQLRSSKVQVSIKT